MTFTAQDTQDLIIKQIGDVDPETGDPVSDSSGVVFQNIETIWEKYAGQDLVADGLRELYVRRDCIRLVLGVLATRVYDAADNIDGLSMRANHIWEHYSQMYEAADADLRVALSGTSRQAAAQVGQITATFTRGGCPTLTELLQYGGVQNL